MAFVKQDRALGRSPTNPLGLVRRSASILPLVRRDEPSLIASAVELGARVVHLQFFVWKVSMISNVEQTFQAKLNLRASYEEDPRNLRVVETEKQWRPNMFPWHPQLRFFNMQSLEDRDEWWRVTTEDFACELDFAAAKAAQSSVWVHQNLMVRGTFEEMFE